MKPASAIGKWLSAEKQVLLRINADTTEWFRDDLQLARAPGIAGILLPKAQSIDRALEAICAETGKFLLPQIETAQGFANARALASAPGVQRLLFGTLDFQMDLGIDGEGDELAYYRSEMVLLSRLAEIQPPVDGPCTALDDAAQLTADTRRAKRMGFGGKLCIHPRQVGACECGVRADCRRTDLGPACSGGRCGIKRCRGRVGWPHGRPPRHSQSRTDRPRSCGSRKQDLAIRQFTTEAQRAQRKGKTTNVVEFGLASRRSGGSGVSQHRSREFHEPFYYFFLLCVLGTPTCEHVVSVPLW